MYKTHQGKNEFFKRTVNCLIVKPMWLTYIFRGNLQESKQPAFVSKNQFVDSTWFLTDFLPYHA